MIGEETQGVLVVVEAAELEVGEEFVHRRDGDIRQGREFGIEFVRRLSMLVRAYAESPMT